MRDYIAIDTETTSLSHETGRIIEIGAVRFSDDGEVIDKFHTLVNPLMLIDESSESYNVNRISNEMVKDAPNFGIAVRQFLVFIAGDAPLLAHNATFDARFLSAELSRWYKMHQLHREVICTVKLSKSINKSLQSHSLPYLVMHYGLNIKEPVESFHEALADCLHVKNLWCRLRGSSIPDSLLFKAVIRNTNA